MNLDATPLHHFTCHSCAADHDHDDGHELLTRIEAIAAWAVLAHADRGHRAEYTTLG